MNYLPLRFCRFDQIATKTVGLKRKKNYKLPKGVRVGHRVFLKLNSFLLLFIAFNSFIYKMLRNYDIIVEVFWVQNVRKPLKPENYHFFFSPFF